VTPPGSLAVAATHPSCTVLGPGRRFVVWVQGCPFRCRGCVSPQWLPSTGGTERDVDRLAAEIAGAGVDGLTVSGGEPLAQAGALVQLVRAVRALDSGLDLLVYTGYSRRALDRHGSDDQRALLALTDILVDGRYVESLHADLLWRASRNQRIHFPTGRYSWADLGDDVGAGLQFEVTAGGGLAWLGVPPVPGFRARYERELAAEGVVVAGPGSRARGAP
jgi:anaerobic ribonucleoside-triphosphate reductase activating protein